MKTINSNKQNIPFAINENGENRVLIFTFKK